MVMPQPQALAASLIKLSRSAARGSSRRRSANRRSAHGRARPAARPAPAAARRPCAAARRPAHAWRPMRGGPADRRRTRSCPRPSRSMIARAGTPLPPRLQTHFMGDAVRRELRHPPRMRLVAEIGEDDDVGDLADPPERLERARDQRLAVHFAAEEAVEQGPDLLGCDRLRRSRSQRVGEIAALECRNGRRAPRRATRRNARPCGAAPRRNR